MKNDQRLANRTRLLAGDIGATKTNLALLSSGEPLRNFSKAAILLGDEYPSALDAIRAYFKNKQVEADYACIGVAGPVIERRVHMINLDWMVDAAELEESLG